MGAEEHSPKVLGPGARSPEGHSASSSPRPATLSFDGVCAWYGRSDPVLDSGGMVVEPRTVVGLVGKNGAGKTTLVNALCGIHHQAVFDDLRFEGSPCSPQDILFKRVRYACFSQDGSFRYWTFDKLIKLVQRSFSVKPDDEYLVGLLEGFEMSALRRTQLSDLSDGQRKKAALVSALYARRPLLLLDEPVDFLDFSSTEFLYEAVGLYARSYGSIILCSHVAESLTRCCTCLYALVDGRLEGAYPVPERPENVARLLAC